METTVLVEVRIMGVGDVGMKCNNEKSIGWDLGSGLVWREQMDGWNVRISPVGDRNYYYALNPKPETLNVNISSCTAMSTNLKTLYLDAIWLKYQGP